MTSYTPRVFTIPSLEGISDKSVQEHVGLYEGYVKNFNAISALMKTLAQDIMTNTHAISELQRRSSFEFDGMRLHEYYFEQLEGGANSLDVQGSFVGAVIAQYGSLDIWVQYIKSIAMMRGPGWAMVYFDTQTHQFQCAFVGEQHQGHLVGLPVILALDVWEHAFLLDYGAQGKAGYVDAFLKNINWLVVEKRFAQVV